MSRSVPLIANGSVVLNGSGNGQVSLGPLAPGIVWHPDAGACIVNSNNNTPVFQVYLNQVSQANFLGGSQTGNNDSCSVGSVTLYPGMIVIGVWTGGDPGATATFSLTGTMDLP